MKFFTKMGLVMLANSFFFLGGCEPADEPKTEVIAASDELVSSEMEPELEVTRMPLPLENSKKRPSPLRR